MNFTSSDKNKIYGGTRYIINYPPPPQGPFDIGLFRKEIKILNYFDFPFSLTLDTIFLPITIPLYYLNRNPYHNLFRAIDENDVGYINNYIKNKKEIDVLNDERQTPLMYSIQVGNFSLVKLFLDNGADINFKSPRTETPLRESIRYERREIRNYLLKKGVNVTYSNVTDIKNNEDDAIHIYKFQKDCNVQDFRYILDFAGWKNYIKLAEKVFQRGCGIPSSKIKEQSPIPLMRAASHLNFEITNYFLKKGFDPNKKDSGFERTTLIFTIQLAKFTKKEDSKKLLEIAELLIKKGANTLAKDNNGKKALDYLENLKHNYIYKFPNGDLTDFETLKNILSN
ncbi:MAG: ankyrin repeat domain-containing protein, partial [Leptospiraceae bacterium]|nr:ankyrin repeat domain-containing protein [Leptospiraceae bacterium]